MKFHVKRTFSLFQDNTDQKRSIDFPQAFVQEQLREGLISLIETTDNKIEAIKSLRQIYYGLTHDALSLVQAKLFVEWCYMSADVRYDIPYMTREVMKITGYSTSEDDDIKFPVALQQSIEYFARFVKIMQDEKIVHDFDHWYVLAQRFFDVNDDQAITIVDSLMNEGIVQVDYVTEAELFHNEW